MWIIPSTEEAPALPRIILPLLDSGEVQGVLKEGLGKLGWCEDTWGPLNRNCLPMGKEIFKYFSSLCCHIPVYWWILALHVAIHLSFSVIGVIADVHTGTGEGIIRKASWDQWCLSCKMKKNLVRNFLGKRENLGKSTNLWISTELDWTAEGWSLRDFVLRWWRAQQRYRKIREAKRKNSTPILSSHKGKEKILCVERAGNFYFYVYFK